MALLGYDNCCVAHYCRYRAVHPRGEGSGKSSLVGMGFQDLSGSPYAHRYSHRKNPLRRLRSLSEKVTKSSQLFHKAQTQNRKTPSYSLTGSLTAGQGDNKLIGGLKMSTQANI